MGNARLGEVTIVSYFLVLKVITEHGIIGLSGVHILSVGITEVFQVVAHSDQRALLCPRDIHRNYKSS
jgi:hypothetical protein